jgi:hypothetical protein
MNETKGLKQPRSFADAQDDKFDTHWRKDLFCTGLRLYSERMRALLYLIGEGLVRCKPAYS